MKSGILKRALRRLLCLLLAAVLLPFPQKAFAEDAKLITVNAEGWMEERNCMPQLLLTDDGRCYISLEDAAKIAGFPLFLSGGTATFRGPNTEVQVELRSLQHRKYEGEDYYALEELMDRLCVFVCASQEGKLVFHSPLFNLDRLQQFAWDVLRDQAYNANYLNGLDESMNDILFDVPGSWEAWLYGFGNAFDIIKNQRFNAFWGGAYREDTRKLMIELLQPIDDDSFNPFSLILNTHKKLYEATEKLLTADKAYETVRDFMSDFPLGSDGLIFGIENSYDAFDTLSVIEFNEKVDLADLFFLGDYPYSGMRFPEYREALKEAGVTIPTKTKTLGFKDLMATASLLAEISLMDGQYAQDMDLILGMNSSSDGKNLVDRGLEAILEEEAEDLVEKYRTFLKTNGPERLRSYTLDFLDELSYTCLENVVTSSLKSGAGKWNLLKLRVCMDLMTFFLNHFSGMKIEKQVGAVREMFMLAQMQEIFRSRLHSLVIENNSGAQNPYEKAMRECSALRLYLKTAWHAIDRFSEKKLGDLGVPTLTLKTRIDEAMSELFNYPAILFHVVPNSQPLEADRLIDIHEKLPDARNSDGTEWVYTVYYDSGEFNLEPGWDAEPVKFSYAMPEIRGNNSDIARINGEIRQLLYGNEYFVSGSGGAHILHYDGGKTLAFGDYLPEASRNETGGIYIVGMDWESGQRGTLLSLKVGTSLYGYGKWVEPPEYRCWCLDTETGKALSGKEILQAAGLEEWEFTDLVEAAIENECVMAWTALEPDYYDGYYEDLREAMNWSVQWNSLEKLYSRGIYLYEDGTLGIAANIDNGSAYSYTYWIKLDPGQDPEEPVTVPVTPPPSPDPLPVSPPDTMPTAVTTPEPVSTPEPVPVQPPVTVPDVEPAAEPAPDSAPAAAGWTVNDLVWSVATDSGSTDQFLSTWYSMEERIPFYYDVPQIQVDSADVQSINAEIMDVYHNYVDEYRCYDVREYEEDWILQSLDWVASVQNNRLLFLAVEYVKLGRTFPEPNYLLYCVDLTTGRRLKGGEMLSALGLDDARFGAQAHLAAMDTCRQNYNALCMEMNGSYPTEDDSGLQSLLENTMLRNQSTELVGRGVFVDGSGNLYALAYIDDVSAYGGKWMLVRVLM